MSTGELAATATWPCAMFMYNGLGKRRCHSETAYFAVEESRLDQMA